jgi:ABC-type branched-subunit amino acid transport system substrate-binding protein
MGRVAARNARADRGFTKGAVLHVPGVFGEGLRDSFQKEFVATEAGGVMVEARELSPDKPEQWGAAAKELVAAGAEAIFVIAPPEPSRQVAQAVAGTSLHAWFIDWSMHPPVLDAAGSDGRGQVHWVNRTVPGADFESKYTGRHQARPEYSAGAGYDAAKITSLAANVAKSTWHEDISATMADLKGIESAFGTAEMVKQGGLVYLDRAGYRLIEPVPLPGTDKWVFGGFE